MEKGEGDVVRATFEQKFGGSIIAGADLASQVIISAENPVHKDYIAIPFSFSSVKKKKVLVVAIFKADNGSDFYFVCSEDGEPFVVASVASRISISPSYASLDVSAEQRVNGHKATPGVVCGSGEGVRDQAPILLDVAVHRYREGPCGGL